jgi:hypothetical protein
LSIVSFSSTPNSSLSLSLSLSLSNPLAVVEYPGTKTKVGKRDADTKPSKLTLTLQSNPENPENPESRAHKLTKPELKSTTLFKPNTKYQISNREKWR